MSLLLCALFTLLSVPSRAADTDKILLSIPDAGGLRLAVSSDNKLHTHVAGHDLPPTPVIPVVGFTADASGYVNGGSVSLQAIHKLKNIFGTGLDIKILPGTKLTANTTGITLEKVGNGGGVSLLLPLEDNMGNKTEVDIAPLTIGRDGTLQINAHMIRTLGVNLPGGLSLTTQWLQVDYTHHPGSDDDEATVTLGDAMHGGVDIKAPIPGILTQNPAPLTLHVDFAKVNTDGQISFDGAKLSQTAFRPMPTGTQVASLQGFAVKPSAVIVGAALIDPTHPLRIPLMKPADFVIIVEKFDDVSLSMENNIPKALTIKCKVELPSSFSTTPGGTDRVTATNVLLDIAANGFTTTLTELPQAYFKGFGVKIHNATLDLSETQSGVPAGQPAPSGGNNWQGVYLQNAELVLPESVKLQPTPPPTGTAQGGTTITAVPPTLTLANAWIDDNGFTGDVTLAGDANGDKGVLKVEDFGVKLTQFAVSVKQSSLKKCDISGKLDVETLGKIDVDASVADSGLSSLHVKTGKLSISQFNAEMEIQNGTIQRIADKTDPNKINTLLALTGKWTFTEDAPDAVEGLSVQINDLLIDSSGKFALESVWIDLPEDTSLDMDVVTLTARKIGFGGIGDGKTPWVGFNGDVGIGGDLPIQVQADFDGLYIYAPVGNNPPEIHVGRIGVDCNIKDIIHVTGYIEQTEGTMTRTVLPDGSSNLNKPEEIAAHGIFAHPDSKVDKSLLTLRDGKPLTILSGRVAIELPILSGGTGGGPGGEIEFLIARNCWFAMGSFSSNSAPLIPLGQSGLAIYGFGGGVGYNIKPELPNSVGIPARNYQVIPDIAAIDPDPALPLPSGPPNIIALASVRLGSVASPPPIWGDVTLVVDVGHLTFTLQGDCFLGEAMPSEVPAITSNKSRVLSATISYDVPNATFIASGYADLSLPKKEIIKTPNKPDKDNTLVRLYAPFAFKIGNYDPVKDAGFDQQNNRVFYAKLGGPVDLGAETDKNGIKAHRDVTIANPVTVKVRGLDPIEGAVTVDVNRGQFMAALKVHQTFATDSGGVQSKDLSLATIKYEYKLAGEFDMIGWLQANVKKPGGGIDMDSLNASGEFYIYAKLTGQATHLHVDPIIGWGFGVPDISLSAMLEADLSGEFAAPATFKIHGQAYADLGFTIADHPFSLPFSKEVSWPAL